MIDKIFKILPWRFRSMHNFRLTHANMFFSNVLNTPQLSCMPESSTEVHSLVCKRDLYMYLLAAKSFLLYCNNVAIIAHDDGTLSGNDCEILKQHIEGIKIIRRSEADMLIEKAMMPEFFRIRNDCFFMLKVFDFNFFNQAKKTILLDSDILFISSPDEAIEFVNDERINCFYNSDPYENTFRTDVKDIGLGLPNFNSGFIGYSEKLSMYTLCNAVDKVKCYFEDQTIYSFLLRDMGAVRLERSRFFVHDSSPMSQEACMVHFISSHRFSNSLYLQLARKVVKNLQKQDR